MCRRFDPGSAQSIEDGPLSSRKVAVFVVMASSEARRSSLMRNALLAFVAVTLLFCSSLAAQHKHGGGEKHKLGRKTIGDYTVSVIVIGEAEAGAVVDFDIKLI